MSLDGGRRGPWKEVGGAYEKKVAGSLEGGRVLAKGGRTNYSEYTIKVNRIDYDAHSQIPIGLTSGTELLIPFWGRSIRKAHLFRSCIRGN